MLSSLTIDNFRGFSHLEMRELGRVNLLVGMNNCGKTSVLEAIQLLVARGHVDAIYSIADRRGELLSPSSPTHSLPEVDISRFFHNYGLELGSSFCITGMMNNHEESFKATILELQEENFPEYSNLYTLSLNWEGKTTVKKTYRVSPHGGLSHDYLMKGPYRHHEKSIENYLIPANSLSVEDVVLLFESTVLTPEEELVVEALQLIEPTIERLATVGVEQRATSVFPPPFGHRGGIVVKCTGVKSRIPIGSLGDGIWRMLGLILALVRSQGGVVLIDEIDSGLHFTVMSNMWKLVYETAKRLNVQVFATTHSNDCWTSLAEIVSEDVSSGSDITIQRIERNKVQTIAFTERKIAIAASRDIEVR